MSLESNTNKSFSLEDQIDLKKVLNSLWDSKMIIATITSIFAIVSIIYALMIPNEYEAVITLAPSHGSNSASSSLSNSQIGGIASLAGIELGSSTIDDTKIAINIMQSWSFIEEFINTNNLEAPLAAGKYWDSTNNKIVIDENIYNKEKSIWIDSKPTSWSLFKNFTDRVSVVNDPKSGIITASLRYFSPILAKEWLELYISEINQHMRIRKLNQANKSIIFLEEQIANTPITKMKDIFYQIIAEETKNKMLAEASPEYVFVTVSKAMIPEEKSRPTRSIIVIILTLFGGIIAVLYSLIRFYRSGGTFSPDE
jgi:uncharacterized protein involved in exopolysaccharide biosynthesis